MACVGNRIEYGNGFDQLLCIVYIFYDFCEFHYVQGIFHSEHETVVVTTSGCNMFLFLCLSEWADKVLATLYVRFMDS